LKPAESPEYTDNPVGVSLLAMRPALTTKKLPGNTGRQIETPLVSHHALIVAETNIL
jgi:hypothetical protein